MGTAETIPARASAVAKKVVFIMMIVLRGKICGTNAVFEVPRSDVEQSRPRTRSLYLFSFSKE